MFTFNWQWPDWAIRIKRQPSFWLGLAILLGLALIGLLAPWLSPHDPLLVDHTQVRRPPDATYWLGTDTAGRDLFSRLLHSIRLAYGSGLVATLLAITVGTALGTWAGYRGGWVDTLLLRLVDLWIALPGLLFLLVVLALLGRGVWQIVVAIGLAGIPFYIRVVRGLTIHLKAQLYVEAAVALGASSGHIVWRHILPNCWPALATLAALHFGTAVLAIGSLSFLGLGVNPPTPELGNLLYEGRGVMRYAWWRLAGPMLVLWLIILGTNLISDSIAEG
jgi:ABC-type dipeptide/oligopeptide/nickel transport system permease subunit